MDYKIIKYKLPRKNSIESDTFYKIEMPLSLEFILTYSGIPLSEVDITSEEVKNSYTYGYYSFEPFFHNKYNDDYVDNFIKTHISIGSAFNLTEIQSFEILALISKFWNSYVDIYKEEQLKDSGKVLLQLIKKRRFYDEKDLSYAKLREFAQFDDSFISECHSKLIKKNGYGDKSQNYHNEETSNKVEAKDLAKELWRSLSIKIEFSKDREIFIDPRDINFNIHYDGKNHLLNNKSLNFFTLKALVLEICSRHKNAKTDFYNELLSLDWENPDFTNLEKYCKYQHKIKWRAATVALTKRIYQYLDKHTELKYKKSNFKSTYGASNQQKSYLFSLLILLGLKRKQYGVYKPYNSWKEYSDEVNAIYESINVDAFMKDLIKNSNKGE